MSYLTAFNNQLVDFAKELCEMFPTDTDIKWSYNMISMIKKANPRKLYEVFIQHFTTYRSKILAKDESFFTSHDFREVGNQTKKQEYTQTIVKQLKTHWSNMSENSRNMCWLRFEILFKISDRIVAASSDTPLAING